MGFCGCRAVDENLVLGILKLIFLLKNYVNKIYLHLNRKERQLQCNFMSTCESVCDKRVFSWVQMFVCGFGRKQIDCGFNRAEILSTIVKSNSMIHVSRVILQKIPIYKLINYALVIISYENSVFGLDTRLDPFLPVLSICLKFNFKLGFVAKFC